MNDAGFGSGTQRREDSGRVAPEPQPKRCATLPVEEIVLWLWADPRYFAMPTPRSDALKGRTFRGASPRGARVRSASRPGVQARRCYTARRREPELVRIAA